MVVLAEALVDLTPWERQTLLARAVGRGAPPAPGLSPFDVAVDVRDVLDRKRTAMAAHASQIPESTSALQLPTHHFADVYGWEWYVRSGPRGPLDGL